MIDLLQLALFQAPDRTPLCSYEQVAWLMMQGWVHIQRADRWVKDPDDVVGDMPDAALAREAKGEIVRRLAARGWRVGCSAEQLCISSRCFYAPCGGHPVALVTAVRRAGSAVRYLYDRCN